MYCRWICYAGRSTSMFKSSSPTHFNDDAILSCAALVAYTSTVCLNWTDPWCFYTINKYQSDMRKRSHCHALSEKSLGFDIFHVKSKKKLVGNYVQTPKKMPAFSAILRELYQSYAYRKNWLMQWIVPTPKCYSFLSTTAMIVSQQFHQGLRVYYPLNSMVLYIGNHGATIFTTNYAFATALSVVVSMEEPWGTP